MNRPIVRHQVGRCPEDNRRKRQHQGAERKRAECGPPEHRLQFALVGASERLCGQSRRRGPEEAEAAIDEIEEDRADRETGQRFSLAKPADDCGIGQSEQRRGQEAERHRHRDRKHQAMRDLEGPRHDMLGPRGRLHQADNTIAQ